MKKIGPGLLVSAACGLIGILLQSIQLWIWGSFFLEALVIALLIGICWRFISKGLNPSFAPGIQFSSKQILEFGVVLLGASIDFHQLFKAGWGILGSVAGMVFTLILFTQWVGRILGLNRKTALLLGVGNGICGNSAIAAVAPIIGADAEEVGASIGFTALLSIAVVLFLPLLPHFIPMGAERYGMIAGLTVYAVPQVLAATFPVSAESVATATLVKLTRVLMLAPVAVILSLFNRKQSKFSLFQYVPWFMVGFFILATFRNLHWIEVAQANQLRELGRYLTIISMGAIGLSVDLRKLKNQSGKVVITVILSILYLLGISIFLSKGF